MSEHSGRKGLFLAFEGVDGAGKTTQSQRLVERLRGAGVESILVREPGSTDLGEQIREMVKHGRLVSPVAELMLFAAGRAELMVREIGPALDRGDWVVADRFTGSTVAYQGYGRGLDEEAICWANDLATSGRYPDLTFLLDIAPEDGRERCVGRQPALGGDGRDRFETQQLEFYENVRRGYLNQYCRGRTGSDGRGQWALVDARASADAVFAQVWSHVSRMLEEAC